MRVTQSMLSGNMLHNLNNSYGRMSELQDQLNSGSKINRPSQDPVIAVKSMGYRRDLGKVEQFSRNMNEVNSWLDATDDALSQLEASIHRVHELVVDAANDTKTAKDREAIAQELEQIHEHMRDLGNTEMAGVYIFSGTNTLSPLFKADGTMDAALPGLDNPVEIEVFEGVNLKVNANANKIFKTVDDAMTKIVSTVKDPTSTGTEIGSLLGLVNEENNPNSMRSTVLTEHARIGAMQNRAEIMQDRLDLREIMVKTRMRDNESVDYSKAITEMVTHESIHQAALSVGARIIQPTLVDFMR